MKLPDSQINEILGRTEIAVHIAQLVNECSKNIDDITVKRGIYIYGDPSIGKTEFVRGILNSINVDTIYLTSSDIRNKSVIIQLLSKHKSSSNHIMHLINNNIQQKVIVMDEIYNMNFGDKGGLTALCTMIHPKKIPKKKKASTASSVLKTQSTTSKTPKDDLSTILPVICIGGCQIDKKIKELMNTCHVVKIPTPTSDQIFELIQVLVPNMENYIMERLAIYVRGNLQKLISLIKLYIMNPVLFTEHDILSNAICPISLSESNKIITKNIFTQYSATKQLMGICDNERTTVGLMWHENVIDILQPVSLNLSILLYIKILDNICLGDYIDRIMFQKQIWHFGELSSLIKTSKNSNIINEHSTLFDFSILENDIRFTKALTKFSSIYSNFIFMQTMCRKTHMNVKDILLFFIDIQTKMEEKAIIQFLEEICDIKCDTKKRVEVNRMYKIINFCTNIYAKHSSTKDEIDEELEFLEILENDIDSGEDMYIEEL